MPEPTDILLPLPVAERIAEAMGATEEHAAASTAAAIRVERRLGDFEARVAPALDAYQEHLAALARERNNTVAARAEGRGAFERLVTGKAAIAIYGAIVFAIATYISGLRGCVPEPVREAVVHAAETTDAL